MPRLGFGVRTALASCLAMALTWLIGLEHPQWAAMTVWAVSQPVRGMLVEKSLFRGLGTVVGTTFGIVLVLLGGDNLPLLVVCLSLWIGLCVAVGNLLHGLLAYGTLLCGYSASMVVLLNNQQPVEEVFLLGADRLLTVLSGIVVALIVGLIFTSRDAEDQLSGQVRRSTAKILRAMAERLAGRDTDSRADTSHRLLKDIAMTEQLFEDKAAGSLRNRREVRALRSVVQAQVGCIFWIRSSRNLPEDQALAAALEQVAKALELNAPAGDVLAGLETALTLSEEYPVTAEVIRRLLDGQREQAAVDGNDVGPVVVRNKVVLHRDWIGARHATLRATGLLLLIGAVWIATGWSVGAYVMLGVSVMITLFSTFETPSHIMGHIFVWQVIGATAALTCHWLIWTQAAAEWQLLVALAPFILLIVPFFAHSRFMLGSVDYIMVLLLLSQPAFPFSASFSVSLQTAMAVVSGPLLAYIAFKTVWPADARRRRIELVQMMLGELTAMAAAESSRAHRHSIWQSRLYHRLLKLVQSVNRSGKPLQTVTSGSLAVLAVGNAIQQLQSLMQNEPPSGISRRRIAVALQRLEELRENPRSAARALQLTAGYLWRAGHPGAWEVENAARSLYANTEFFRTGALPKKAPKAEPDVRVSG